MLIKLNLGKFTFYVHQKPENRLNGPTCLKNTRCLALVQVARQSRTPWNTISTAFSAIHPVFSIICPGMPALLRSRDPFP